MAEFFQYWKVVLYHAGGAWWEFVWTYFVGSALVTLAVFVLGAFWEYKKGAPSESFRQWLDHPMRRFKSLLKGGVYALAFIGLSFLVFLFVVSPWRIHGEQQTAIKNRDGKLDKRDKKSHVWKRIFGGKTS